MYSYQDTQKNKYAACQYGADNCFTAVRLREMPFTVAPLGLPMRDTLEEAQADMDWYALFHGLERVSCGSV